MIRPDHDPVALADGYAAAQPFPHAVIDGFLEDEVAHRLADHLEHVDVRSWSRADHPDQINKWWMSDLTRLGPEPANALAFFNSARALSFFEQITGIETLLADPTYLGGGVHISGPGGRLGVHADFNLHPDFKLHRRVNALLFLNRDWDVLWNGNLELFDDSLTTPIRSIVPIFNRLAVFSITDRAFYGVPRTVNCPETRRRISLALYYYTIDRPIAEKGPFHWASWQRISNS